MASGAQRLKLLIASKNAGKCSEIRDALAGPGLDLVSLAEVPGLPAPREDETSYEENALGKARHYHALSKLPTLADDSGLEVEVLGGRPGVRSARFAGERSSYAEKNGALLRLLEGIPDERRRARFVCAVAYVDAGARSYIARGTCDGRVAESIRGTYGFGYDPIFIPDGFDETFGELGEKVKRQISHRARALSKSRDFFRHEMPARSPTGDTIVPRCKVVSVDPHTSSGEIVAEAAAALLSGELIAYPTDTLYGLGSNAADTESAQRLVQAKGRPPEKPISVIVDCAERARSLAKNLNGVSERLMEAFWPGPLTVVVEASECVPPILSAGTGTIGVRVPSAPLARAISERADVPITATSANRSGERPGMNAAEIVASLGESLSLVLDCGTLRASPGSTVVAVTGGVLRILRQGVISEQEIRNVFG